jgi:hypothetical protein
LVVGFVDLNVSPTGALLIKELTALNYIASHEPSHCDVLTSTNVGKVLTHSLIVSIATQIIITSVSARIHL